MAAGAIAPTKEAAGPAPPTSTGTWVIVDKAFSTAAKNAQPLDRVSPMQHGFERMVDPVLPLLCLADPFLLDLSPVLRIRITRHSRGPRGSWPFIAGRGIVASFAPRRK